VSDAKAAFKALTAEQQALVKDRRLADARTPDAWLRTLEPVAAFDRLAERVSVEGGFFARRFARKHAPPRELRQFVLPLVRILAADGRPDAPLGLDIDLTGAQQPRKQVGMGQPYAKGNYPKVVDSFFDDPWLQGEARFADGARVRFAVVKHLRASLKQKRNPRGKTKRKLKTKAKTEVRVHVSLPTRNYAPVSAGRPVPKSAVRPGEHRTEVKLGGTVVGDAEVGLLLELISAAYERVEPSRRKKL
jgi:hypothetical protein